MSNALSVALLNNVAPCSLLCYTCPAYKDGAIAKCAAQLCKYFEGYYDFNDANLPEQYRSWLDKFETFYNMLDRQSRRPCPSCRNNPTSGSGCIDGCVIPSCVKERGINFCAECTEFPCAKATQFFCAVNETICADWLSGSQRIKEVGIKQYFEERKLVSHYLSYKKDRADA